MKRELITFSRITPTQDPVTGALTNVETDFYSPKGASVREITPSIDVIAQQQNVTMLIEIKLRYNPEIEIRNGDKITWRGYRFNSLTPSVDPLRRWITIKAFSEIETTSREP